MAPNPLITLADSVGTMMSKAAGVQKPEVDVANSRDLSVALLMAGEMATFTVDTLFGFPVRVTISKAGGMFQ